MCRAIAASSAVTSQTLSAPASSCRWRRFFSWRVRSACLPQCCSPTRSRLLSYCSPPAIRASCARSSTSVAGCSTRRSRSWPRRSCFWGSPWRRSTAGPAGMSSSGSIPRAMSSPACSRSRWKEPIEARLDPAFVRRVLAAGVPLALGFTITTVYAQLDVVLLQALKGFQMVGWYAAANRFIDAVAWIPQSAMGAVFPALSLVAATESRRLIFAYEKSFKMLAIVALPLAVGISVTADSLVTLAFGHAFDQSIPALRILAPSIALLFVNNAFIYTLTAINRQVDFTRLSLATLVVNVALNLLLIPPYGYLGAAAASTLTEAALFAGGLWLLRRQLAPLRVVGSTGRAIASAAVMGGVLYPIRSWPLAIVVIVGAAVYLAALFYARG
ncbi:MAG: flippase [Chloroflexi bacterium]|nr:MAG: flippase [Chloroflexota bacterium]